MQHDIKRDAFMMLFPSGFRLMAEHLYKIKEKIYEIRVRKNAPLCIYTSLGLFYLNCAGEQVRNHEDAMFMTSEAVESWLLHLCRNSLYAYKDELAQGYLTVQGGHRIGVVGQVIAEREEIETVKYISSMNIRVAHEIIGCAKEILPALYEDGQIRSTLIVSPPMCGKTTLLRDLIRCISNGVYDGRPRKVCVADERGEIAAAYMGCLQNDLGYHTDVFTNCRKADGMIRFLRSMSPELIATDELGSEADFMAVREIFGYGCKILATMHAQHPEYIKENPKVRGLINSYGFERMVGIGAKGRFIPEVYDCEGKLLYSSTEVKR